MILATFHKSVVIMQTAIPHKVGIAKEANVHFQLPVSFFIVRRVVLQGKCKSVNSITLTAVSIVQPFCSRIFEILAISSKFTNTPCDK